MAMQSLVDREEPLDEPDPDDDELEAVTTPRPVDAQARIREILLEQRRGGKYFCHIKRYKRASQSRRTDSIAENSLLTAVQHDGACNSQEHFNSYSHSSQQASQVL